MIISYLVYIGLLIFCYVAAYFAKKRNKKEYVWLIVVMLTLIAGLRHSSVGIDTQNYLEKFDLISQGQFKYAYGLEFSFKIICFILLKIIPSKTFLFVLIAFITNWCIIMRFWELRRIAHFSMMVVCYYLSFYFMTMNVMRQFCAIGILFYSTRYLVKRNILYYVVGMLIAVLFHQSALLGCVFLLYDLVEFIKTKKNDPTYKKIFYVILAVMPVMAIWIILKLIRYWKYFSLDDIDIGIIVPAKILFFAAAFFFIVKIYRKVREYPKWTKMNEAEKNSIILACISYIMGLCFLFASYFFPIMNRIGWYFTIHECVCMGIITKIDHKYYRYIFMICVIGLIGIGFVTAMTRSSQGTMPYLFFWQ